MINVSLSKFHDTSWSCFFCHLFPACHLLICSSLTGTHSFTVLALLFPVVFIFFGLLKTCYSHYRLPWWPGSKEFTCQCRRHGFDPWVRKIPWRRKWQPTLVFLPGKSHGQRSLVSYSPRGWQKSWTQLSDETTIILSMLIFLWCKMHEKKQ